MQIERLLLHEDDFDIFFGRDTHTRLDDDAARRAHSLHRLFLNFPFSCGVASSFMFSPEDPYRYLTLVGKKRQKRLAERKM
jgi:hypothetical protein